MPYFSVFASSPTILHTPTIYVHFNHYDVEKNCEMKHILNKLFISLCLFFLWLLINSEEVRRASYIATIEQTISQGTHN